MSSDPARICHPKVAPLALVASATRKWQPWLLHITDLSWQLFGSRILILSSTETGNLIGTARPPWPCHLGASAPTPSCGGGTFECDIALKTRHLYAQPLSAFRLGFRESLSAFHLLILVLGSRSLVLVSCSWCIGICFDPSSVLIQRTGP